LPERAGAIAPRALPAGAPAPYPQPSPAGKPGGERRRPIPVAPEAAAFMPLPATPDHFAKIIAELIGRPYGWGNLYFYNDCSAELKSLMTPFGIWLPRHSSHQLMAGRSVDVTSLSPEKRLAWLMQNGRPLMTLVYIGGHVFLYTGNTDWNGTPAAMTYQNFWGLSPNPPSRRAVVGKSAFFPLLMQYPEDASLTPLVAKKYFQVSFLDEMPNEATLMPDIPFPLGSLMELMTY